MSGYCQTQLICLIVDMPLLRIQRRLKELGHEQSDYPQEDWEWRRMMYQPRPLTARSEPPSVKYRRNALTSPL